MTVPSLTSRDELLSPIAHAIAPKVAIDLGKYDIARAEAGLLREALAVAEAQFPSVEGR